MNYLDTRDLETEREDLKVDYSEVTFGGTSYLYR